MPLESLPPTKTLPVKNAFRHLIVFQLKLVVDAVRDLVFSPISFVAFIIDTVTRPTVENSLSLKVMHWGRRSDRVINLFNEYSTSGEYTIDYTVAEVETAMQKEMAKRKKMKNLDKE
jgi:hypothetical protein